MLSFRHGPASPDGRRPLCARSTTQKGRCAKQAELLSCLTAPLRLQLLPYRCNLRLMLKCSLCTLQAICHHLFTEQNFRVPPFGRSNIPSGVIMDHPGVYENAKFGYLHETLISRQGIPAVLAILLEQVCQRLLTAGAIDFAVRVDCSALDRCRTILCILRGIRGRSVSLSS